MVKAALDHPPYSLSSQMCIVGFAVDAHPTYKLLLASNRDEFLNRPTATAAWRSASLDGLGQDVLCGLDTVAGGTWLGLTKDGRLGVLTNFTEPPPPYVPSSSRGSILKSYLSSSPIQSPSSFLADLAPFAPTYAGFNVLLFQLFPSSNPPSQGKGQVGYLSNRMPEIEPVNVESPVGAVSNSLLDDPWDKTVRLTSKIQRLLDEERESGGLWSEEAWLASLEESMNQSVPTVDRTTFKQSTTIPPLLLPPSSGLPGRYYATRLLTMILVQHDGSYTFVEKDVFVLDVEGLPTKGDGKRVLTGKLNP